MSKSSIRIYIVKAFIHFSQALAIAPILRQQRIRKDADAAFAQIKRQTVEDSRILQEERDRAIVAAYAKAKKLEMAVNTSAKDRCIRESQRGADADLAEQEYKELIGEALAGVRSIEL